MRIWYAALVVLCCLPAAGCRTNQHIAALQRDNRLKEDEIYRLRWQLEDCEEDLERCGKSQQPSGELAPFSPGGQTLFERLTAPSGSATPALSDLPVQVGEAISPNEFLKSRDVEKPPEGPVLPSLGPANDDVPAPSWPEPADIESDDEAPAWSPQPAPPEGPGTPQAGSPTDSPVGTAVAMTLPASESHLVAQLRIDASATGGRNFNSPGSHDGLLVVIELCDKDGRPVRAPAEVSLVLLDASQQGDAARVARWDFTEAEVAAAIRASEDGERGIPLKVVWPDSTPQNENLHLFVRYITADGRRLEDQAEVRIRLTESADSAGWRTAPQHQPPPPPRENRATTHPDPPAVGTRVASRPDEARRATEGPPTRLPRPQWSPNRP